MDDSSKVALTDSGLQQSAIINEKLECKNRMGEIKRGKKRCESPVTADRCQLAQTLPLFFSFWKSQGGRRCTSHILTSLGEIVPAPEPVSGPVPCRF